MAEESGDAKPPVICLPLSITISVHHTLLLLLQSPEPEIAIAACKALLAFARDEEDGPTQVRTSPWSPGFQVEPIQTLQRLLSHEEAELQGLAVTVLAVCAAEEPFRLRTVELDALAPMIKQVLPHPLIYNCNSVCFNQGARVCYTPHALLQLGHEDVELQARAAYALAMHAIDDPVRLKVQQARCTHTHARTRTRTYARTRIHTHAHTHCRARMR